MNLPLPARVLSKLVQVIGHVSSNQEDIFSIAAGQILELFDVDACYFGTPAEGGMQVHGARARDPQMQSWLLGREFATPCPAFRDGMLVCVNDARENDTCSDGLLDGWARSHLCLPLSAHGERVGTMTVAAQTSHTFTPEEIDLYLAISSLVAIAVQNSNMLVAAERQAQELRDQVRARTRSISAVNRISERINASSSRDEVANALKDEMGTVTDCDTVTLALLEDGHLSISVVRGKPKGIGSGQSVALADTVLSDLARTGNARVHTGRPPARAASLVGSDARSFAIVPLMAGKELIGSLNLARLSQPGFEHANLPNVTQVAGQIVAALRRIEMFEREKTAASELKTLYEASNALTSTVRLRDTFGIISNQLAVATLSDVCLVFRLDDGVATLITSSPIPPERLDPAVKLPLPSDVLKRLAAAVVYEPGKWSGASAEWLESLSEHLGRNIILAPVIEREIPVALAVLARRAAPYTAADLRISSAIAGQAAVAIQASQVYEHERTIAEAFQKTLLPRPDYYRSGLCVASRYQAAREEADVGGDFCDIIEINDHLIGLAVGDISGKGLKAATQAASMKYMLNAYALQDPSPAETLARLNNAACQFMEEGFATLFYGLVNLEDRTLTYANAGHELPVRMINGDPTDPLEVTGPALALYEGAPYSNEIVELGAKDLVLCYTDGITEARSTGGLWGYEGLMGALQECRLSEPRVIVDHVYERALAHSSGRLADDVILMAISRSDE